MDWDFVKHAVLLAMAGGCLVGKHYYPELEPLGYILLTLVNPSSFVSGGKQPGQ